MTRPVRSSSRDVRLLAMLMQAEARGEGYEGMDMVGTVGVNRIVADCPPDFRGLRTIPQMVYQTIPGTSVPHFEPVQNGTLWTQRPGPRELTMAWRLANGKVNPRVREALFFLNPSPGRRYRIPCPPTMPRSPQTRYLTSWKNHCFYGGVPGYCVEFYGR